MVMKACDAGDGKGCGEGISWGAGAGPVRIYTWPAPPHPGLLCTTTSGSGESSRLLLALGLRGSWGLGGALERACSELQL